MSYDWERRKILIWGKTRPEISQKYRETVCTGGVFENTKKLVRLYPIPLRFLGDKTKFKKYQWIEADVKKSTQDVRPESYKIRIDTLRLLDVIKTKPGDWTDREKWIINDENIFTSVEDIIEQQSKNKTSLGLIKPKSVVDVRAEKFNPKDRDDFWEKCQKAIRQIELDFDEGISEKPPLVPPDYRFKIHFTCNDDRCESLHKFTVLDWEVDALYYRQRKEGDPPQDASQKVVEKLKNVVCSEDKDLYFFLGNFTSHQHIFSIVGLWYPKKRKTTGQMELFS